MSSTGWGRVLPAPLAKQQLNFEWALCAFILDPLIWALWTPFTQCHIKQLSWIWILSEHYQAGPLGTFRLPEDRDTPERIATILSLSESVISPKCLVTVLHSTSWAPAGVLCGGILRRPRGESIVAFGWLCRFSVPEQMMNFSFLLRPLNGSNLIEWN